MNANRQDRFIAAMRKIGASQSDLADLLGLSGQSRISEYLTGKRTPSEPLVRLIEIHAGIRPTH